MIDILESEFRNFGLNVPADDALLLARYCQELVRWNAKINLTSLQGTEMVRRLVAEPAWIAHQLQTSGVLVDIGSGNGSPAIPLRVLSKRILQAHLVESRLKRAVFLRHVISALDLSASVMVHRSRFEDLQPPEIEAADWVTLQAVALTPQLLESIQKISMKTTTIVWITSGNVQLPLSPRRVLSVPITGTQVFLFQLDLT